MQGMSDISSATQLALTTATPKPIGSQPLIDEAIKMRTSDKLASITATLTSREHRNSKSTCRSTGSRLRQRSPTFIKPAGLSVTGHCHWLACRDESFARHTVGAPGFGQNGHFQEQQYHSRHYLRLIRYEGSFTDIYQALLVCIFLLTDINNCYNSTWLSASATGFDTPHLYIFQGVLWYGIIFYVSWEIGRDCW
jgi:hypothetical protein